MQDAGFAVNAGFSVNLAQARPCQSETWIPGEGGFELRNAAAKALFGEPVVRIATAQVEFVSLEIFRRPPADARAFVFR